MRIYYIDESEGPRYYVRSALGVNAERWNGLHGRIQDWRTALAGDYSVPTSRELHACDPVSGTGQGLCWPDGASWPASTTPAAGSPRSREPRSSWTACAS